MNNENNKNGYIALYKDKKIEVYADTTYQAQQLALVEFQKNSRRKIKGYDVSVFLCEKNGESVTHTVDF
ncbi:MAG: hypothetical protein HRT87_12650 [Legionellales bacterium]|nr:hypothetical protein [Legionellales bacterium]